jgi:hypothetical protein
MARHLQLKALIGIDDERVARSEGLPIRSTRKSADFGQDTAASAREQGDAMKKADKAERKAKQAQKEAGDLKDAAVKDATDTSNEAKGAIDRMTAPE